MRFGSFVVLVAVGCGTSDLADVDGKVDSDPTGSGGTDDTADTGTTSGGGDRVCSSETTASPAGTCPGSGTALIGRLVDVDGKPLGKGGFRVQYCRDVCLVADCFDGNAWSFSNLEPGDGSFDIVPLCDEERFAPVFAPLVVDDGMIREVEVVVPRLGPATPLPAASTEIEVVKGLFLTVADGQIAPPSPLDPAPTEVAGVDASAYPVPIEGLVAGEVVAVYYLDPFDYEADPEIAVRLDNAWSLADGEAELWVGNYAAFLGDADDAPWEKVGTLTVDGDGKLATTAGLPRLSTLVVIKPTK